MLNMKCQLVYGLENLLGMELAEFHNLRLVAGRTQMSVFASKGQDIFLSAVLALDPGESVIENATLEVSRDEK